MTAREPLAVDLAAAQLGGRLNALAAAQNVWATSKGWWEPGQQKTLLEQLTLMHSELSEVAEEWRAGRPEAEVYCGPDGKPEGIPVELADLLLRVLDTAAHYGIDLEQALLLKATYNASRPYRHGGKRA